ncbi:MAG TPA: hypothetical protein VFE51_05955 [Verrucomicrobiae bacterium]|nr:hypothetical protein [Verrucomicrobiae bacterium]
MRLAQNTNPVPSPANAQHAVTAEKLAVHRAAAATAGTTPPTTAQHRLASHPANKASVVTPLLKFLRQWGPLEAAMEFFEWVVTVQVTRQPSARPAPPVQPSKPAPTTPAAEIAPRAVILCPGPRQNAGPVQNPQASPGASAMPFSNQRAAATPRICSMAQGRSLQFVDDEECLWVLPRTHLVSFDQIKTATGDVLQMEFTAHRVLIECHAANQSTSAMMLLTEILADRPAEPLIAQLETVGSIKVNPEPGYELPQIFPF